MIRIRVCASNCVSVMHYYRLTHGNSVDIFNRIHTIQLHIHAGIDVNYQRTPDSFSILDMYVARDAREITKLLISYNADVNVSNGYPIQCACWRNQYDIAVILINAGANIDERTLKIAFRWSTAKVARLALEACSENITHTEALKSAELSNIDRAEKIEILTHKIHNT